MKRDPRLHALSSDHHHALVLARRAKAARTLSPDARTALWDEVVRRFHDELAPHFDIEERLLLPALDRVGETALSERTRAEHAHLRRLIADPPSDLADALVAFGDALHDHVRFEERTLFEAAQRPALSATLDAIAEACRDRPTAEACR